MLAAASVASELSARRDLGVAWMNRGHTQLLQDNATGCAAALVAYEQAIALLRPLPVADNPSWANSLGAAWMNHGQLLHRVHGLTRAPAALASFDAAAAVLRPLAAGENPWARRNLAGTELNRANLLLDLARPAEAAAAARAALSLCSAAERSDLVDADLALKARRALGDAIGQLLVVPGADQDALATEASDVVDEALAVVRHWHGQNAAAFRLLALRFFRYGTQLYRFHQPHFLAEFIHENLPLADADFHAVARDAIDAALADRPRAGVFLTLGDLATERRLRTCRELENLRTHFAA
jgi:tetratricopeptide (TPR) repeat protein